MADRRWSDDGTGPVPALRDVPPSGLIPPTAGADATASGPVAGDPFGDSLTAASPFAVPPPAGSALAGGETVLDFGRFPDATRISPPDLAGPPPPPPPAPPSRPTPRPSATPAPAEPPVRRAPVEPERPLAVEPAEPVGPVLQGRDQVHLDPLLYRRVRPRDEPQQTAPRLGTPWAPPPGPRGTVPWQPPGSPPPRRAPGDRTGQPGPGRPRPGPGGPGRQQVRRGARPWWLLIVAAILIFNLARGCGRI